MGNLPPGRDAAREGDAVDSWVRGKRCSRGAASRDDIHETGWSTGLRGERGESERREGGPLTRLDDHGIATRERRNHSTAERTDGTVPREDDTDHPKWLTDGVRQMTGVGRDLLTDHAVDVAGPVSDHPCAATAVGERLAQNPTHVAGVERREFRTIRLHEFGPAEQNLDAASRVPAHPLLLGIRSGTNGTIDVDVIAVDDCRDYVAVRGVDRVASYR